MMLKVAPASDYPGGLFHARESLMLGWIALALILWLVAAIRTGDQLDPVILKMNSGQASSG